LTSLFTKSWVAPAPSVRISTLRPGRQGSMPGSCATASFVTAMWSAAVLEPGVARSKQPGRRLTHSARALVDEREERMAAEAALERRCRTLLVRMRGRQRRVKVHDQRVTGVDIGVRPLKVAHAAAHAEGIRSTIPRHSRTEMTRSAATQRAIRKSPPAGLSGSSIHLTS
jgi:hypothetical protein